MAIGVLFFFVKTGDSPSAAQCFFEEKRNQFCAPLRTVINACMGPTKSINTYLCLFKKKKVTLYSCCNTHCTCINSDRRSLISMQNKKNLSLFFQRSSVDLECNVKQNIQQP